MTPSTSQQQKDTSQGQRHSSDYTGLRSQEYAQRRQDVKAHAEEFKQSINKLKISKTYTDDYDEDTKVLSQERSRSSDKPRYIDRMTGLAPAGAFKPPVDAGIRSPPLS
jgi:hypothetical protein